MSKITEEAIPMQLDFMILCVFLSILMHRCKIKCIDQSQLNIALCFYCFYMGQHKRKLITCIPLTVQFFFKLLKTFTFSIFIINKIYKKCAAQKNKKYIITNNYFIIGTYCRKEILIPNCKAKIKSKLKKQSVALQNFGVFSFILVARYGETPAIW